MSSTLSIKDFGPLNLVKIELKKFNIIIGPQSSGKSCILKIAAFCRYAESLICSNSVRDIEDGDFVGKRLINYYKLGGFINPNVSEIMYDSPKCKLFIIFPNGIGKISYIPKQNSYYETKVAYIPAERNLLAIPGIDERPFFGINLSDTFFEWKTAKLSINKGNQFDVLNLGVSYYYDQNEVQDKLSIGESKDIPFNNASSGLQSVVPVCILINHYMHSKPRVVEQYNDLQNLTSLPDDIKLQLRARIEMLKNDVLPCDIFLEEPEISIFPETQYEFVKWIVNTLNSNGLDNSISIATHSPYILGAFNNLVYYSKVVNENPNIKEDLSKHWNNQKMVDVKLFSAYSLNKKDGTFKCESLINPTTLIIGDNSFDKTSENIADDFEFMYSIV